MSLVLSFVLVAFAFAIAMAILFGVLEVIEVIVESLLGLWDKHDSIS